MTKNLREASFQFERAFIARVLVQNYHNRTNTAVALGIARRTLVNKIKVLGLSLRADVRACSESAFTLEPVMYTPLRPDKEPIDVA